MLLTETLPLVEFDGITNTPEELQGLTPREIIEDEANDRVWDLALEIDIEELVQYLIDYKYMDIEPPRHIKNEDDWADYLEDRRFDMIEALELTFDIDESTGNVTLEIH